MSDASGEASIDAARPRRTYGRSKAAVTNDDSSNSISMVFAAPQSEMSALPTTTSPGKTLADRWSSKRTAWLGSLSRLDASPQDEEDVREEEIKAARQAARERLFKISKEATSENPQPSDRQISAFSSTTLTDPPSSTPPPPKKASALVAREASPPPPSSPPRPAAAFSSRSSPESPVRAASHTFHTEPTSPAPLNSPPISSRGDGPPSLPSSPIKAAANDDIEGEQFEADDSSATARALRSSVTPVGSPAPAPWDTLTSIFNDEGLSEDEGEAPEAHSTATSRRTVKGISKAEAEQAHRDAARALRERQPELSKPEPTRRPLSEWFQKASQALTSTTPASKKREIPRTSPGSDIRQFTSQATPSSAPHHLSQENGGVPRTTSSPTPHALSDKLKLDDLDGDDNDDLEIALNREDKKKLWAARKAHAMKASMNTALAQRDDDDDDDDFIIEDAPPKRLIQSTGGRVKISDPRAYLNQPTSSKQAQLSFGRGGKMTVPSQRAKGGPRQSRKSGGADGGMTRAQLSQHLANQYMKQAHEVKMVRENNFGASRPLPKKETLEIAVIKASATPRAEAEEEDSDGSDEDYAPDSNDEDVVMNWSGDEAEAGPSNDRNDVAPGTYPADNEDEGDQDKENKPIVSGAGGGISDDEEDDDGPQPVRRRPLPKRTARLRVAFASDDEGDDMDAMTHQPLREVTPQPPAHNALGTPTFVPSGSGDGDGDEASFSQLFAETQAPDGYDNDDALAGIRDNGALGLVPADQLLPSVQISETQKRRDNALIAAEIDEAENAAHEVPKSSPMKQYLNTQGYFTQTRPAEHATQMVEVEPLSQLPTDTDGEAAPSSTLINSSEKPSNGEASLTTLASADEETFTRLRRRQRTPPSTHSSPGRSPIHVPNAFDALRQSAARDARQAARQVAATKRKEANELIDEQAELSDDEDGGWGGWGPSMADGDEDEEGDDTGYVAELVDDTAVDEDVQEEQDALAAAKHREVAEADDARREAEAKKVTEGHYRRKRRGNDFMSDEEDEDGKSRRLSKKQRRLRKLEVEGGQFLLPGESMAMQGTYEDDMDSDNEFDETPMSPVHLASPEHQMSAHERQEMLRRRARMNAGSPPPFALNLDMVEESSSYVYARATTRTTVVETDEYEEVTQARIRSLAASRSIESYSKYVSEESLNPRRNGGGAVSVVVQKPAKPHVPGRSQSGSGSGIGSRVNGGKDSGRSLGKSSGSVLLDRKGKFSGSQ